MTQISQNVVKLYAQTVLPQNRLLICLLSGSVFKGAARYFTFMKRHVVNLAFYNNSLKELRPIIKGVTPWHAHEVFSRYRLVIAH